MVSVRPSIHPSVRLSVCPSVTFVYFVETNKHILSTLRNHTILVFLYQSLWQYFDGDPLMGALNAGEVHKNRDSWPVFSFVTCC